MEIVFVPVAHVSRESAERVREAIEREKPGLVAVELDVQRLQALREKRKPGFLDLARSPFFAMLYLLQQFAGSVFHVAPGTEMLAAVEAARERGLPVALVDRPIGETLHRLSKIPAGEKLRLAANGLLSPFALLLGWILPGAGTPLEKLTEEETAAEVLGQLRARFPETYRVLVEERNEFMLARTMCLPFEKAVLVVGAGHVPGMKKLYMERGGKAAEPHAGGEAGLNGAGP
jgi:pheromone shutdown protein TraB